MLRQKYEDVIAQTAVRIMVPFVQLYALYVLAHGHYSPGGGFQGGVILAAALVLIFLVFGYEDALDRLSLGTTGRLCSIGVLIYAGIGFICLLLGGNFLDYSRLASVLQVTTPKARSLGILGIETGVALTVMAAMYSIIMDIVNSETGSNKDDTDDENQTGEIYSGGE
ncbi:MAG: Na(+)/H(+) antiporter subunit B [Pseudomonadota bacterium]|nr:Na(+)/H(+) antiporter subunit B [Pseudomonadota bacterium]